MEENKERDEIYYVKVPENLFVIDFDLRDKDGNKSGGIHLNDPPTRFISVDLPAKDSCRPPETIKKDIKHEKNPMGLKRLNQELNKSYKIYRTRRK